MTQSISGIGGPKPTLTTELQGDVKTQSTKPGDVSGAQQSPPQTGGSHNVDGSPALLAPAAFNPADMMLQLTSLMSKIAELSVVAQEEGIKADRAELKQVHEKRMDELKKYYENLAKAAEKNVGFFGRLVRAVKALFSGDIKGAFEQIGKAFTENPVTAILTILAPFCPFLGILAACMAFQDQELMTTVAKLFGASNEDAEKFGNVMKWIGVGVTVTVMVAAAVAAAVLGVAASPLTGGGSAAAGLAVAAALIGATIALVGAGMGLEAGIKGYQAGEAQSDAYKHGAEADRTKASSEELMGVINKNMSMMQDLFDNLQAIMASLMKMMQQQQEGAGAAAGAV